MSDYYEELGVSRDASNEEIRAAFRRKAKKHHPDRAGGDADKMAKTNRAYQTLSDPVRRLKYDRTGEDGTAPSQDKLACDIIVSHVSAWIAAEHNSGDMMTEITFNLDAKLAELKGQARGADATRKRIEKRMKRLKARKKGADFLRMALDHMMRELDFNIEKMRDQTELYKRAKEMLAEYDYEKEVPQAMTPEQALADLFQRELGKRRF